MPLQPVPIFLPLEHGTTGDDEPYEPERAAVAYLTDEDARLILDLGERSRSGSWRPYRLTIEGVPVSLVRHDDLADRSGYWDLHISAETVCWKTEMSGEFDTEWTESPNVPLDIIRTVADPERRGEIPTLIEQVLEKDPALAADVIAGRAELPDAEGAAVAVEDLLDGLSVQQLAKLLKHPDREVRMKVGIFAPRIRKAAKAREGRTAASPTPAL